MRRLLLAGSILFGAPAAISAQVGTQVWTMRVDLPDSMASRTAGLTEIEFKMTFASNGTAHAMQMEAGPAMVAAFPMIDLSAVRFLAVLPVEGDSFHVGVVFPPELAAQLGGGIGWRVDGVIPDSLPLPATFDSLMQAGNEEAKADFKPEWKDTGRRSTAGGLPCEEWTMTVDPKDFPAADTTGPQEPVVMQFCLAEKGGLMTAWTDWMKRRLPQLMTGYDQLHAEGLAQFGGRDMVPLRMELTAPVAMKFELVSQSDTAPDASFFKLPDGLEPFPMEMFGAMMPGQSGN